MGVSTDAYLCLGVPIDEDDQWDLPWKIEEDYYDDLEDWWQDMGNEDPPPAQEVYHCSDEYPMLILAVPGSVKWSWRGHVEEIEGEFFTEFPTRNWQDCARLKEFLREYDISDEEPRWCLVSEWG